MRNPSLANNKEGDLSRLTTSSSSSSIEQGNIYLPESDIIPSTFSSTYLPEVIDPVEWQTSSRKRKERQDSTSSTVQDKKLVRSNSEEYIPCVDYEVIRRVVSHEEFKHPLQDRTNGNVILRPPTEQRVVVANEKLSPNNNEVQEILRETHRRTETSPARTLAFDFSHKYRISPHRDGRQNGKYIIEDVDGGEHERRRNSERFCKARAQVGRKSQSSKKSSKHLASKLRERDENVYKYDVGRDRRGFVSKMKITDAPDDSVDAVNISGLKADHNDNNLSDAYAPSKKSSANNNSKQETLPWDQSCPDETPVICPRFSANTFDHVAQSRDASLLRNSNISSNNGLKNFVSAENIKTRDLMIQNIPPATVFSTPDERLKQINKRLVALKKRVANFEENFERENGYRPSHSEKLNDKFTKYALGEIHKLRKDKQQIKSDPAAAMGLNNSQKGGDKVIKMKETLAEIEKRLHEKRMQENRPTSIEDLSPEQLVQEKTAVQKALLYLESLFGRPNTKDERDAARTLYDRYRQIKRTLNRSASLTASGIGISELPTILEHEAMHFQAPPPTTTTTTTIISTSESMIMPLSLSDINSPTDNSQSIRSTDSSSTSSSIHENIHTLSVDELRKHLDIVRDEKKELRRTIKEFEELFEERNGRKMLKSDRCIIEDTYALYKQKKAKLRLLDALIKKHTIGI